MKTITIQGTDKQIETFRSSLSFDINEMPKQVQTRVYVIDTLNVNKSDWANFTDEEFIELAEEQGNIYTLQGFTEAFNNADVNSAIDVIRFISVPLSL